MRRPSSGSTARVAAVALLAVVVVFSVLTVQRWRDRADPAPTLAEAPVAVAETAARDFFTLDHRTLDDDVERVLATATGEFETQYRNQSADLRASVEDNQLVLTAAVPESGVALEHLTGDEAWLIVSVDVHTEGAGGLSRDGRYRTRVVLQRDGDSWLVARLEQVG